jgi:hypothetical protein
MEFCKIEKRFLKNRADNSLKKSTELCKIEQTTLSNRAENYEK